MICEMSLACQLQKQSELVAVDIELQGELWKKIFIIRVANLLNTIMWKDKIPDQWKESDLVSVFKR